MIKHECLTCLSLMEEIKNLCGQLAEAHERIIGLQKKLEESKESGYPSLRTARVGELIKFPSSSALVLVISGRSLTGGTSRFVLANARSGLVETCSSLPVGFKTVDYQVVENGGIVVKARAVPTGGMFMHEEKGEVYMRCHQLGDPRTFLAALSGRDLDSKQASRMEDDDVIPVCLVESGDSERDADLAS